MQRVVAAGALLLAVLSALPVCAEQGVEVRRPNLLLITVDTLRPDRMSLYGAERATTRELDGWLQKGRVYGRAYSVEANTSPSVATMLTGLLPQHHGVRLLFQKVEPSLRMLPDLLREHGYQTAAVVSNIVLTDEAMGMAARFDHYDDFVDEDKPGWSAFERRAERTTDAALAWLARARGSEKPQLLWVHYIDPHGPYDAPERVDFTHEGSQPIDPERVPLAQRSSGITDGLEYIDRYDEEIAYADFEIARLLRAWEALGFADGAYLLFTSDHGETMMEFDRWFTHGYHIVEPIVRVPLILVGPGIAPGREDRPVSLVSVMPTLLELAGAEVPDGLDGASLLSAPGSGPIFAEASDGKGLWRTAIEGNVKWTLRISRTGRIERRNSYEINDEATSADAPWRSGPAATRLLELSESDPDPGGVPQDLSRGIHLSAPKVAPDVDPDMLEKLEALGYVE